MRIRSGGPQGTQGTQKTQKSSASSSAQAAKFAGMVGSAGSSTDQQSAGKDQMMAALQALARRGGDPLFPLYSRSLLA